MVPTGVTVADDSGAAMVITRSNWSLVVTEK
jgi:hypothetical protein